MFYKLYERMWENYESNMSMAINEVIKGKMFLRWLVFVRRYQEKNRKRGRVTFSCKAELYSAL